MEMLHRRQRKENFVPSAENKAPFVDLTELNQYNLGVGNYANPCELYQTILDSTEVFPNPASENGILERKHKQMEFCGTNCLNKVG